MEKDKLPLIAAVDHLESMGFTPIDCLILRQRIENATTGTEEFNDLIGELVGYLLLQAAEQVNKVIEQRLKKNIS